MDKIEQLEKIESALFRVYNLFSQLLFLRTKITSNSLIKKNINLKERETDTCVICGNGPSLANFKFDKIGNVPVFTVNYFFDSDLGGKNISKYHIMIDDALFRGHNFCKLIKMYNDHPDTKFIFRLSSAKQLLNFGVDLSHAFFVYGKLVQHGNYIKCDMTKNSTACINVVNCAIQCAIFMGYKKIYLAGCDANLFVYPNHFYDEDREERTQKWGTDIRGAHMMFKHYNALEYYAQKHDIKILNITPESWIDAFEFMPLNEFYNIINS